MKIIRRSEYVTIAEFNREFNAPQYANRDRFVGGRSFPCDAQGNVDVEALNIAARANYEECIAPGSGYVDMGVADYSREVREPAIGRCDCGEEVVLAGFTNTCDCGADYNSAGQRLAAREQWGEETGETANEILRIP